MEIPNKQLLAGYAQTAVTPPMGMHIPGYFEVRVSDGVITDLHLRAIAFSDGENKAILFSCDAIGVKSQVAGIIKKMVAQRCDLPEDAVYIHCTHSHTAFRMEMPLENSEEEHEKKRCIFMHRLYQQFCDCAQFAFEDLKPCRLMIADGHAEKISFNRRYEMKDGSFKTNPKTGNPDILRPAGPVNDALQLLRVVREGGKEILLIHFGTHPDVIGGTKYCADWPGYTVDFAKNAFGGEVEAMVLNGAQGDVNHLNPFLPKGTRQSGPDKAQKMARVIVGEVLKIYDFAREIPSGKVQTFRKIARIGQNPCKPEEIPIAREMVAIYDRVKTSKHPDLQAYPISVPKAVRIAANLENPEFFEMPLSGLQIGNLAFIGIPGEPFTQIGVEIRDGSKMDMTFVTCCTNGYGAYYPTADAYAVAGYEADASRFAPDCARVLVDTGLKIISEMEKIVPDRE